MTLIAKEMLELMMRAAEPGKDSLTANLLPWWRFHIRKSYPKYFHNVLASVAETSIKQHELFSCMEYYRTNFKIVI